MAGTAILLFAYGAAAEGDGSLVFGLLAVASAVGGPLLGVWLDRARSGWPLTVSLALFAGGLALVGLTLHTEHAGLALVLAAATGLFGPAVAGGWSAGLTSRDQATARRLAVVDASSYSVAGLAGPALAGVAFVLGGPVAPLLVTLILLGIGAAMAPLLDIPTRARRAPYGGNPLRALVAGTRAITRNPRLRTATASSCIAFFGFGMFAVLVPEIGRSRLGSPGAGTALLVVLACAALASNAILERWAALRRPRRVLAGATALAGAGIALTAGGGPVVLFLAAAVIGAGDGPQLAALIQIRHQEAPDHLRTQVFTTGASLKITSSGAGALAASAIVAHGLGIVLLIAAAMYLFAAAVAVRMPHDIDRYGTAKSSSGHTTGPPGPAGTGGPLLLV